MIRFHYIEGHPPEDPVDFPEDTHWGTIEDGKVIAENESVAPDDQDFAEYLEDLHDRLLDGIIDPIAVTEHTQYGPVHAVVPAADGSGSVFDGSTPRKIISNGELGDVEAYEAEKYFSASGPEFDDRLFKEYELKKPFTDLVIHSRSDGRLEELGRIDVQDREVRSVDREPLFRSMVESVKREAPTMNPVGVLKHNSRRRVAAVVDPSGDELLFEPADVKRSPDAIRSVSPKSE